MTNKQWLNFAELELGKYENKYFSDLNLLTLAVLEKTISDIYSIESTLTENELDALNVLLERYLNTDQPVAQIVGFEYFMENIFKVNDQVLIPRMDTEILVRACIEKISNKFSKNSTIKVLDMCCGTGCIGISLTKILERDYQIDLTMSDISKEALKVAKDNCQHLNVKATIVHSDLFTNLDTNDFDVIISNPPYIPYESEQIQASVVKYEPHLALFADDQGLALYKQILRNYANYVADNWLIAFEIGDGQFQPLQAYANELGINNIELIRDLNQYERVMLMTNEV